MHKVYLDKAHRAKLLCRAELEEQIRARQEAGRRAQAAEWAEDAARQV